MAPSFQNLVDIQQHTCREHASRNMYGTKGDAKYDWITFGEFGRRVDDFRSGLASLGIGRGDKVAIISANCVEWAVSAYAVYGLSAHFVPMYESQTEADWTYILRDSGARALLVRNPDVYEKVRSMTDTVATLEHVIPLFACESAPTDMDRLTTIGRNDPRPAVSPEPEEPMGLTYTSGTTGNPKGVILTHGNLVTQLEALYAVGKTLITPNERGLSFLPWGHLMGQIQEVHLLIYAGFSSALVRDINEIVEDLALARPTLFFSVPRLFNKIYDGVTAKIEARGPAIRFLFQKGLDGARRRGRGEPLGLSDRFWQVLAERLLFRKIRALFGGRLRAAISGGAALNPDVVEFLDALGIPVYEGYGQTETTMAVTLNVPGARKVGSVGRPVPNARVVIDKSVGETDPAEGEIVVYGPLVMPGYHNLPEETAATIDPDGGLRTGDIGRFDADGYLHLTGRIKEIYKLENGKYVSPGPLEEQLKMSPYIEQVLITGLNRLHNVALILPAPEAVRAYARDAGVDVDADGWTDAPAVQRLFEGEIEAHSAGFRGFEKPARFAVLWDDWSIENGFLTPTLKLKRRQITERYREIIDGLYE